MNTTQSYTTIKALTNTMYVTLHASREIIIDDLPHTLEIHPTSHDFRADHHPALAFTHPADSILSLLLAHARMQTIHIWNAIQHQLFS
jgi:hypothetical protein